MDLIEQTLGRSINDYVPLMFHWPTLSTPQPSNTLSVDASESDESEDIIEEGPPAIASIFETVLARVMSLRTAHPPPASNIVASVFTTNRYIGFAFLFCSFTLVNLL